VHASPAPDHSGHSGHSGPGSTLGPGSLRVRVTGPGSLRARVTGPGPLLAPVIRTRIAPDRRALQRTFPILAMSCSSGVLPPVVVIKNRIASSPSAVGFRLFCCRFRVLGAGRSRQVRPRLSTCASNGKRRNRHRQRCSMPHPSDVPGDQLDCDKRAALACGGACSRAVNLIRRH
jgi:hypothetical protein